MNIRKIYISQQPYGIVFSFSSGYQNKNDKNAYLQVEFDIGSCKTLATIAGHLQKDADYCRCLPTSSKLADCLARYGGIQNHG